MEPTAPAGEEPALCAGRYALCERIGVGAAGTVYRAHDRVLGDAVVAVKLLNRTAENPASVRRRFQQEMQLLQSLSHPNIVRVFDFGRTSEDVPFIVMEYLEGSTLQQRLEETGGLPPAEAQSILNAVLQALEAMHRLGIIHRDLKPANVHLGSDGTVKLLDFGISKNLAHSAELTTATQAVGTPRYMAPEQLHHGAVDPRSDLYAVGLLAYELAMGVPFYQEESVVHIAAAQQEAAHRLAAAAASGAKSAPAAEYPEAYLACITRALRVLPEERFQLASEFRQALAVLPWRSPTHRVPRRQYLVRALRSVFFVVLALLLLAVGGRAAFRSSAELQAAVLPIVLSVERHTGIPLTPLKWIVGYPWVEATEEFLGRFLRSYSAPERNEEIAPLDGMGVHEPRVLHALLEAGVDPNGKDEHGEPLIVLSFALPPSVPVMREFGADVCRPESASTVLLKAISRRVAVRDILAEVIRRCPHALYGVHESTGNSLLHLLALWEGGEEKMVAQLLAHAPELLERRNALEETPLMAAARRRNVRLATALIAHGADLLARDDRGGIALHHAVFGGSAAMVAALVELDPAQFTIEDDYGRTALFHGNAAKDEALSLMIFQAMSAAAAKETHAGASSDPGSLPPHSRLKAELERRDPDGRTILWEAVRTGKPNLIAVLLAAGADIEAPNSSQDRPLAVAVAQNNVALVTQLLAAGADVNARQQKDRTALHFAVLLPDIQILRVLLAAGADPTLRDADGQLPSERARNTPGADEHLMVLHAAEKAHRQGAATRHSTESNRPEGEGSRRS